MHRIRESNSVPRAKLAGQADSGGSRGLLRGPPGEPLARRRTDEGRCLADPFPLPREGGGRVLNAGNYRRGCDNSRSRLVLASGDRLRWIACQPFDARARSQPTRAIRSPLTRPRAFGTNAYRPTTPRECMATRGQVEASEGVDPSPLGMNTITRDM